MDDVYNKGDKNVPHRPTQIIEADLWGVIISGDYAYERGDAKVDFLESLLGSVFNPLLNI